MHRLLNFFVTAPSTGRPRFISASIIPHFMLGLAISVMLFVCTAQARAQVTLLPTDDAYIDDGTSGSPAPNITNYGSATTLKVKKAASGTGSNRDAYFRFDISGFATITSASFKLYAAISGTTDSMNGIGMNVYSVSDTSWSEGTITSSNNPTILTGGTPPGSGTSQTSAPTNILGTGSSLYSISLTSYFSGRLSNNQKQVSFNLHNPSNSTDVININSKEAATHQPVLVVLGKLNPPTGLSAVPGHNQVTLSWNAPTLGMDTTGTTIFKLYRSGGSSSTISLTYSSISPNYDPQHPAQIKYTDTSVADGTTYTYYVTALNGGSGGYESDPSNTVSSIMPNANLNAPASLTAIPGNGQVKLTWPMVSSATSYNLYRHSDFSGDPVDYMVAGAPPYKTGLTVGNGLTNPSGSTLVFVDLGRINGQSYTYKVAGVRSDGNVGGMITLATPVTPLVTMHTLLSDDTYVDSNLTGNANTTNFGTNIYMKTKWSAPNRIAYLRFGLPDMTGSIKSANLYLYGSNPTSGYSGSDSVYQVTDSGWTQGNISYDANAAAMPSLNAKPAINNKISSTTISGATDAYYTWGLGKYANGTDFLANQTDQVAAGKIPYTNPIGLALQMDNQSSTSISPTQYNSQENTTTAESPPVKHPPILYIKLNRNSATNTVTQYDAENGAMDKNIDWQNDPHLRPTGQEADQFIEYQRFGAFYVEAGVARQDQELIYKGLQDIQWGLGKENYPGGDFPKSQDKFHSTSLFLDGAARAILLLQDHASDKLPDGNNLVTTTMSGTISYCIPRIEAAAVWLDNHAGTPSMFGSLEPGYTHRIWLLAAGLGLAAEVANNNSDLSTAATLADDAKAWAICAIGKQSVPGSGDMAGVENPRLMANGIDYYPYPPPATLSTDNTTDTDPNDSASVKTARTNRYMKRGGASDTAGLFTSHISIEGVDPEKVDQAASLPIPSTETTDYKMPVSYQTQPGYDVSYQTVGLNYAARYETLLKRTSGINRTKYGPGSGSDISGTVLAAVSSGLNWEITRAQARRYSPNKNNLSTGILDITGCSRMGIEVDRDKNPKLPDIGQFDNALLQAVQLNAPISSEYSVWSNRIEHNDDNLTSLDLNQVSGTHTGPIAVDYNRLNDPGDFDVSAQALGVAYIEAGIAREDSRMGDNLSDSNNSGSTGYNNILVGVDMLYWAFNNQIITPLDDPNFGGWHYKGGDPDLWATTQFVEAAARSLIEYGSYTPVSHNADGSVVTTPTFTSYISALSNAAGWLHSHLSLVDTTDAVECFGVAAALGEVAQLATNSTWKADARLYVEKGLALQWSNGYLPTSLTSPPYTNQADGLVYAEQYYLRAPYCNNPEKPALINAIRKGLEWETQWTDTQGYVNNVRPMADVLAAFQLGSGITSTTLTTSFSVTATRLASPGQM